MSRHNTWEYTTGPHEDTDGWRRQFNYMTVVYRNGEKVGSRPHDWYWTRRNMARYVRGEIRKKDRAARRLERASNKRRF